MDSTAGRQIKLLRRLLLPAWVFIGSLPVADSAPTVFSDPAGDVSPHRTDPGADGPVDASLHHWPDILSCALGAWQPASPASDLFIGNWSPSGGFFRFDLVLAGLANPPGSLGCCGDSTFDPFRYGPHPVFGYVEFDADADPDTGGEVDFPNLRYDGNAARFGGMPSGTRFENRIALGADAFDGNLATGPYVERSGEDFEISLFGWELDAAGMQRSDLSDWLFGPGETWIIPGHFFQRAHGYRYFSSACCRSGAVIGSYEPMVQIRFHHDVVPDVTTITLVYPLTNTAAAAMISDAPVEPMDALFTNQNSILEALWELKTSAQEASAFDRQEPEFALLAKWETKTPEDYLDPAAWSVSILLGGSYTSNPSGPLVVWSDILPNVKLGDTQGDGKVDHLDVVRFNNFIKANDGKSGLDADGRKNGRIQLPNVGPNFSLYDLSNDGSVTSADRVLMTHNFSSAQADFDEDADVDQSDFGHLQNCLGGSGQAVPATCDDADLDGDDDVDIDDLNLFVRCITAPAIQSDPACMDRP